MTALQVHVYGTAIIMSLFGSGFTLPLALKRQSRKMQIFCVGWGLLGVLMLLELSIAAVH